MRARLCEWTRAFGLALLLGASVAACAPTADRAPLPNIVLYLGDDWSWPDAGAYGNALVQTPNFDRLANEGILFTHAFAPSPSCTAARVSILTGQHPHRLNEGANLQCKLPKSWPVYTEMLEDAGYFVGKTGKGCQPISIDGTAWEHDPAGKQFNTFAEFLAAVPDTQPFCFWYGSRDPHRPYRKFTGAWSGKNINDVNLPAYLPDTPGVRSDLLDYFAAIESFDKVLATIVASLDRRGLSDNTVIVVAGDNGMPFPRAKANCYDAGVRVPLLVYWPRHVEGGRVTDALINLADLAPTFLEAAGIEPPEEMTARSMLPLLTARKPGFLKKLFSWFSRSEYEERDMVFVERERHSLGRSADTREAGFLSYPVRGVRTRDYLYLRNFRPHLWPACDPPIFADIDDSPTKEEIVRLYDYPDPDKRRSHELCAGLRTEEELYDVRQDPYQVNNLAYDEAHSGVKKRLSAALAEWMRTTGDPRAMGEDDRWDYYGWYRFSGVFIPERPDSALGE